jgi:hypothetical protein
MTASPIYGAILKLHLPSGCHGRMEAYREAKRHILDFRKRLCLLCAIVCRSFDWSFVKDLYTSDGINMDRHPGITQSDNLVFLLGGNHLHLIVKIFPFGVIITY